MHKDWPCSALPWAEGLVATGELFLLAALQALLVGVSVGLGVICARAGVLHVPHALIPGAFLPCDSFCHGGRNQRPCETFPVPPALLPLFLQPSKLMSCEEKL